MGKEATNELGYLISSDSLVVATTDQVSCDLEGESVILHLKSGMYYSLNPLGARIWSLIQQPRSVSSVRDVLLEEYDVDLDRCEGELLALLQQLAAEGLIDVKDL